MKQAKCPNCGEWENVSFLQVDEITAIWWEESTTCPNCLEYVDVPFQCEIKEVSE